MPTYKVKPDKAHNMSQPVEDSSYPSVHLPVSMEIMDMLDMGMSVKVTLKGKVKSMRSDEEKNEICIEVMEVSAYPEKSAKSMKEEIDEGLGYKADEKYDEKMEGK